MSDWMSQVDWGTAGLLAANTLAVLRPFAERFINKALDKTAEKSVEAVFDLLEEKADEGEVEEWAGNPDDDYFRKRLERLLKNDPEFAETLRAAMVPAVKDVQAAGYQVQVQTGTISGNTGSVIVVSGGPVQQTIDQRQGTFIEKQINNPPAPPPPDPVESQRRAAAEVEAAARETYLKELRAERLDLPLTDLGSKADATASVTLERVYVPLDVWNPERLKWEMGGEVDPADRVLQMRQRERDDKKARVAVSEMLAKTSRMVLLGDPGSGKSTVMNKLLAEQATAALADPAAPLPLLVVLRDLTAPLSQLQPQLATLPAERMKQRLWAILAGYLRDEVVRLQAEGFTDGLTRQLQSGNCLLVLDGLDEVPEDLRPLVRDLALTCQRLAQVVVTCRIRSYGEEERVTGFSELTLAPLTEEQIKQFVEQWYNAQVESKLLPGREADGHKARLRSAAVGRLRELAENPMLLTTMAIVEQEGIGLPEQRVQLYKQAVEVLTRKWQRRRAGEGLGASLALGRVLNDDQRLRGLLQAMAYEAHVLGREQKRAADLPYYKAREVVEQKLDDPVVLKGEVDAAVLAREFLGYIEQRAGLIVGRGGTRARPASFAFAHRTFQEYLAGCQLLTGRVLNWKRELARHAAEGDYWGVAVQLALEEQRYNNAQTGLTNLLDLAYGLLNDDGLANETQQRCALWAANAVALATTEAVAKDKEGGGPGFLARLTPAVTRLLVSDLRPTERAEAGRVLAQLGDERAGVGVDKATGLPDIAWCVVPGGPFVMGEDDEQHENGLLKDGYWLGQYPVTQAQFAAFVQAGGYAERRYWGEAEKAGYWKTGQFRDRTGPNTYGGAFELPNHPVVGVSWYEGLAFARWLDEQYRAQGWLPAGYGVMLPSEAEWEKAARGGLKLPNTALPPVTGAGLAGGLPQVAGWQDNPNRARRYPWGNRPEADEITPEHANYADTRIGTTSAVGAFAGQGVSPYGCLDLSGNVWEWTRSVYSAYDKTAGYDRPVARENLAADSNTRRVLRGGSWDFVVDGTRAAYRSAPTIRGGHSFNFGFRVCVPVLVPRSSAL